MTSCVVQAKRANLNYIAYKWSIELVRPENREHIKENYKKNIMNIARRPVKDDQEENKSECPFCKVKRFS